MDENHTVVTRFPPSPTGFLHLGGARTALFNWLYARNRKGRFVLRIEDTDVARSTKESVDAIFEGLEWLGIDWDEGPHFQSERFEIYREYARKLVEDGHAYYCNCPPERLKKLREEATAKREKPKYDGKCRDLALPPGEDTVIRFKSPFIGATVMEDRVKGHISFSNSELDDFILERSDKVPTYNFAVVVDDVTMGINTVIRGDDHVNNTPRQILLYRALGNPLPVFGHVPMVLGPDGARLSKRHGAMSVTAYRDMGYLPDAMINFLVRLGWSYGDQEFFTREELIEKFDLEHIGRSAGIFNIQKLVSLNADHIKESRPDKTAGHLAPFMEERGVDPFEYGEDYFHRVIATLNTRSKTLAEMADGALFYYKKDIEYDKKAANKFLKPEISDALQKLKEKIADLDEFTEKKLEGVFGDVMTETGLKLGKIAQPVRVALTGTTVSPGIFEIVEVLGKDEVVDRLERAIRFMETKEE